MRRTKWNKKVFIKNMLTGLGLFVFFYGMWLLVDIGMYNELGY